MFVCATFKQTICCNRRVSEGLMVPVALSLPSPPVLLLSSPPSLSSLFTLLSLLSLHLSLPPLSSPLSPSFLFTSLSLHLPLPPPLSSPLPPLLSCPFLPAPSQAGWFPRASWVFLKQFRLRTSYYISNFARESGSCHVSRPVATATRPHRLPSQPQFAIFRFKSNYL